MKKMILLLMAIGTMMASQDVSAQKFSGLDKSPHDISYYKVQRNAPPLIKVVYGRPQKKGRKIFGGIVSYGDVWRTGANEATEITFYKDVTFGGKSIQAGTYTLFTIPSAKEWTVILNTDLDVWGAYAYNKAKDVASVSVPVKNDSKSIEAFSITFTKVDDGVHLNIGWDTERIAVPIKL
ncbi:DUF2911 domain-containing protein [Ascidiimonas sp. W6]|uniref:DUF2911 domain-containing protein n=1 Tax=Ascidiimonas meishanensis TaxID=3128903 RepID=UPI0030EC3137